MQDQQEEPIFTPNSEGFLRRYPAITHAALISAFLFPIGLLPYLVARRQINKLHRMMVKLERKTIVLQNALDLTSDTHNIMKGEVKRIQKLSSDAMEVTAALRREVSQQKAERRQSDQAINADLKKLLEETQNARVHAASLHALGTSLADIAAFMQEVELDFGMNLTQHTDRLGIERLRLLARRMQCIDSGHQQVED